MYDERLPFHFLATDDRLSADELNGMCTMEEQRFMRDMDRQVLRCLTSDPAWQKL